MLFPRSLELIDMSEFLHEIFKGDSAPFSLAYGNRPSERRWRFFRKSRPAMPVWPFQYSTFFGNARLVSLYGGGTWQMGHNSLVGAELVCERKEALICIGADSFIAGDAVISARNSIQIGCHCLIAAGVVIQDHNSHSLSAAERRKDIEYARARILGQPREDKDFSATIESPVVIGDDAWIGLRAIILKGVAIGARSIIGAGSVVTSDIPADCIAAGNPARVVKDNSSTFPE